MDPITIIVGAISLIQPLFVEIFKYFLSNKIQDEQTQKSINSLFAMIIGIGIVTFFNWLGDFNLGKLNIVLYGTGLYAIGQASHRLINFVPKLQKNLTVKGRNGDSQNN